jgi:hypothetical protein
MVFAALAAGEPEVAAGRGPVQQRVHQRRLADARLAGHERHLPVAVEGPLEQGFEPYQLGLAPDRRGRKCRGDRPARRPVLGRPVAPAGRGDEPVAAAVDGLDEPRHPGPVPERFADLPDADVQRGVGHQGVAPDRVEEFPLGDQPAGPLGQVAQDGEGLRGQRDGPRAGPRAAPQPLVGRVQAECAEADLGVALHGPVPSGARRTR